MDDAELDRALNDALSVSPSPEFVARVRMTIAQAEAAPTPIGWLKPAAVAVSIAAIAAVLVLGPAQIEIADDIDVLGSRPISNVARAPVVGASPLRLSSASDVLKREPVSSAMPAVLISSDAARAFQELVASARDRRFEASFDETPPSTAWALSELTVAPLSIEPLVEPPAINN
jgi:hypothetical protein